MRGGSDLAAATVSLRQLHCDSFIATASLRQFHCDNFIATISLRQFHCDNFPKGAIMRLADIGTSSQATCHIGVNGEMH
jgi:hypothetical protein